MTISATKLFAALAHQTRLRCILLLMGHGELCVCELTQALATTQPHVSRHLGLLRGLGLVTDRRDGLWIYYRINPQLPGWVAGVLREAVAGSVGQRPFADDQHRLLQAVRRPRTERCI